jgi:hypothetical protein
MYLSDQLVNNCFMFSPSAGVNTQLALHKIVFMFEAEHQVQSRTISESPTPPAFAQTVDCCYLSLR